MAKRDYYDVLGVSRNADEKDLKRAFRKLAMQYHPDRNPDDADAEKKFKSINEAYEVLKDPQKRAAYDQFGHDAFSTGGAQGGFGRGFSGEFGSSMSDIFDDLFGEFMGSGGGRGRSGANRGRDVKYNMEIELEDAFRGKTAEVRVPSSITCTTCSGSGAKPGTSPTTCRTCAGAGKVRASQGFFTIERTCPSCQGVGRAIESPCTVCSGSGRTAHERTLSVNIPEGIEDGTRIRLSGEGEAGLRGGPAGDLYIFISIRAHGLFQRDGADLFCRAPISMTTAALGGQIEMPTLDGNVARVKIPSGTPTGKQFRLRGKGMPVLRSKQRGDLYLQAVVETPQALSRRQRELLEEFAELSSEKTNPDATSFFSKIRGFFDNLSDS